MEKMQAIRHRAKELLSDEGTDWAKFFREILGVNGIIHQIYSTQESLAQFQRSGEYQEILQMLEELQNRNSQASIAEDPIRVITVRLPQSVHESLQKEAHAHQTSMNKLCISKLVRAIDAMNSHPIHAAEPIAASA